MNSAHPEIGGGRSHGEHSGEHGTRGSSEHDG